MGDERRSARLWLLKFAVSLLLIAAIVWVIARPSHRRAQNRYDAYVVLKNLAKAESRFCSDDRDANGVQDFWTGDVAGLFKYGLVDRSVAEADARPLNPLVPKPIPRNGYYFVALDVDEDRSPPMPFRQETDKKAGKVHNREAFGFCAYPADADSGDRVMLINENNTTFWSVPGVVLPPKNWPKNYRESWSPQ